MESHLHLIGPSQQRKAARRERICVYCNRHFRREEHLQRHLLTHTKEKPFKCHCSAAFARRDLLRRHDRIAHPEERVSGSHVKSYCPPTPTATTALSQNGQIPSPPSSSLTHLSGMNDEVETSFGDLPFSHAPSTGHNPQTSLDESGQIYEFMRFLDSVGIPSEWAPIDVIGRDASQLSSDSVLENRIQTPENEIDYQTFHSWLPSNPQAAQPLTTFPDFGKSKHWSEPSQTKTKLSKFTVTEGQRLHMIQKLESFRSEVPDFCLPSRHILTRYLGSFFEGFHSHLLFIHIPTFELSDQSIECALAIMAAGAQYRFEHNNANRLFHASQSILIRRIAHHNFDDIASSLSTEIPRTAYATGSQAEADDDSIHITQCLLILMGYGSWGESSLLKAAFRLRSLLTQYLRICGMREAPVSGKLSWNEWIKNETARRTKLVSFCFLNIHSVAYNAAASIRSSEIFLRLPCTTKEWNATSMQEWEAAHSGIEAEQLEFPVVLDRMLRSSDKVVTLSPIPSPLGSYVVLQGLIQRCSLVRDLALGLPNEPSHLPSEELNKLEGALRSWTFIWQQAPESSLDPLNENGPIAFTSSSLLGLAYIRLSLNIGPFRRLETRDPAIIANFLLKCPLPERGPRLTPALIYAVHAMTIPVRLGIDFLARSQAFFLSVRYCLASMECAVFLSKWLLTLVPSMADLTGINYITEFEIRVLTWIRDILQEANDSIDAEDEERLPFVKPFDMSVAVLRLWARFFRGNLQWPFINIIGLALQRYSSLI
ncbi:unnamed protein product [Penicillium salamii]|nr:unnamed protein product [Penicillium salamii]